MMRARFESDDGPPIILLGVTKANVNRMLAGDPIRVTGASVGLPSIESVIIFYGETEAGMLSLLREQGLIPDDAEIQVEKQPPPGTTQ